VTFFRSWLDMRSRVSETALVAILFAPCVIGGAFQPGFEINAGQFDPQVKFLYRGRGYALLAARRELLLSIPGPSGPARSIRIKLPGAADPEGIDRLPGCVNYLGGPRAVKGVTTYGRIRYRSLQPGIDLILRLDASAQLEYDWIVAPGADPARIRLGFKGASAMRIDQAGDLILDTGFGQLTQRKPSVRQAGLGAVAAGFRLVGKRAVGFSVEHYNPAEPLVIDPVVVYALASGAGEIDQPPIEGGTQTDSVAGIAADSTGNIYVTGLTYSPYFPGPTFGFPPPFERPPAQGYVAKIAPDGTFVYATLFDRLGTVSGPAVDASGAVYFTGFARGNISTAPVTMAAGKACTLQPCGTSSVFVAKLDPTGTFLEYNAYLAGSGGDFGTAIAIDTQGSAYIAGSSSSTDFPLLNAFQSANRAPYGTAFVAKLNPSGTALLYSTYLGGSYGDGASGIAVDSSGNAYVSGFTGSADFPTTPGAFQQKPPAQPNNPQAFVTKFNSAGSSLVYSTLLGGTSADNANVMALDSSGNVFVTSSGIAPTPGAFQTAPGPSISKLNSSGSALVYSTAFGSTTQLNALALDSAGNVYITGSTLDGLPALNPVQSAYAPSPCASYTASGVTPIGFYECAAAFAAELNASGSQLIFSTYLNGYSDVSGHAIAVDVQGNIFVGGSGFLSVSVPTSPSHFGSAFVVKLDPSRNTPVCTAQGVTNAASFVPGLPPGGGLASIFCTGISGISGLTPATVVPLPTTLAGVSVIVNALGVPFGFQSAPLLAVAEGNGYQQINFQVPFEIAAASAADVIVQQGDINSVVTQVPLATSPPGIFKWDATHGAIQHADYSLVTPSHPAAQGEIVLVYCTGLGAVSPAVADGVTAPLSPLALTVQTPSVTIAGQSAAVLFSGLVPGQIGMYQLNVRVPANAPLGEDDLVISFPPVQALVPPYNGFSTTVPLDSAPVKISIQ
jgi:uncharacterized protein (TIGR03437 family)